MVDFLQWDEKRYPNWTHEATADRHTRLEPAREVVRRYNSVGTFKMDLTGSWWNINRVPLDQAEPLMRDLLSALVLT